MGAFSAKARRVMFGTHDAPLKCKSLLCQSIQGSPARSVRAFSLHHQTQPTGSSGQKNSVVGGGGTSRRQNLEWTPAAARLSAAAASQPAVASLQVHAEFLQEWNASLAQHRLT